MAIRVGSYRQMIDRPPSRFCGWMIYLAMLPLAWLYRLIVLARTWLYLHRVIKSYRASLPVVSVGNLTVGGTGKTPLCDVLIKHLLACGLRVALVSRGYGGSFAGDVGVVAAGNGRMSMAASEAGDEPCLLARRNPSLIVLVARKRSAGVKAAEAAGAQLVVLDDGFQHLAVQRDLDIVLLDSRAPFGNGQMLPAGPLREPVDALRRANLLIMTHAPSPPANPLQFHGPVLYCRHRLADTLLTLDGEARPWSILDRRQVVAFAGIARPSDFFVALRARSVQIDEMLALDDHQTYTPGLLNRLQQLCDNNKLLLTTEKDAVKLRDAGLTVPCLVAPLELEFDEPNMLAEILDKAVRQFKRPYHQDTKSIKGTSLGDKK